MGKVRTPLRGKGHPEGLDERVIARFEKRIEVAIGGAYQLDDGREFWIDAPVAREMARRVMATGLFDENSENGPIDPGRLPFSGSKDPRGW